MIGRLERVSLREIWSHEALDFTRWLQDNYEILNDVLGMSLSSVEREQPAGSFSVDLLAEDEQGDLVVIENQLERSDHDHLGKLITYLTAFEAKKAIWIVADPRPEHIRAITWLNESSSASFYMVKLEVVRIGESAPAPLFTLIVGPSEESRQVREVKEGLAERHILRRRFWEGLLERAHSKTKLHANISPSKENWIGATAGVPGLAYNYIALEHGWRAELWISSPDAQKNKAIFDALSAQKEAIERAFGEPLKWQRLDDKKSSRISYSSDNGGYRDEEEWPHIQEAMIDAMIRLNKALKPHFASLPV